MKGPRSPAVLALLLLGCVLSAAPRRVAADEGAGPADTAHLLASSSAHLVARGAWQARPGDGARVARLLSFRLREQAARPEDARHPVLVHLLLDALLRLEVDAPDAVLRAHLDTHPDAVVALWVRRPAERFELLWALFLELRGPRTWAVWRAVGQTLVSAHPRRFARRLLGAVDVVHEIGVRSPLPPGVREAPPAPPVPPPRWRETLPVPEGYPPVPLRRWVTAGGEGEVRLEREVQEGETLELAGIASWRRDDPQREVDWLDACLERAGAHALPRLAARAKVRHLYAGPTPWRRWLQPYRAALDAAWYARVVALVEAGWLGRHDAGTLEAPIRLEVKDRRACREPPLVPLEVEAVENPFAPPTPRLSRALRAL